MSPLEETLQDEYVTAFPENLPFWRAAAEDRFVLPRCKACGKLHLASARPLSVLPQRRD